MRGSNHTKEHMAKLNAMKKPRPRFFKPCIQCGEPFFLKPNEDAIRKTCSKACMGEVFKRQLVGSANPNYRAAGFKVCASCKKQFHSYGPYRKFCSHTCYQVRAGMDGRLQSKMGYASRLDDNHEEIVAALRKAGVGVLPTHNLRSGVPDVLAATKKKTAFLEIKNPKTYYGKNGLNKLQAAFAAAWAGELYVVRSVEEALVAMGVKEPSEEVPMPPNLAKLCDA